MVVQLVVIVLLVALCAATDLRYPDEDPCILINVESNNSLSWTPAGGPAIVIPVNFTEAVVSDGSCKDIDPFLELFWASDTSTMRFDFKETSGKVDVDMTVSFVPAITFGNKNNTDKSTLPITISMEAGTADKAFKCTSEQTSSSIKMQEGDEYTLTLRFKQLMMQGLGVTHSEFNTDTEECVADNNPATTANPPTTDTPSATAKPSIATNSTTIIKTIIKTKTTAKPKPTTNSTTTAKPKPTTNSTTTTKPTPTTNSTTTTKPKPTTNSTTTTKPTSTTNSTTTIKPKPTTNSTTTAKPKPTTNSTTTAKPTPTSKPPTTTKQPTTEHSTPVHPTTAVPTKPTKVTLKATDGNITCAMFVGKMTLLIPYKTNKAGKNKIASVIIPTDTRSTGNCTACPYMDTLTATFFKGWEMVFRFGSDNKTIWWYYLNVTVVYDSTHFPDIDPTRKGKTETFSTNFTERFVMKVNGSYACNSDTTTTLVRGLRLKTTDLQYTALQGNVSSFSDKHVTQCRADKPAKKSSIVPIAVGAGLAALVVIVIVGYLVFRRRSFRAIAKSYETLN